jgi:uncharacterized protein YcfJ
VSNDEDPRFKHRRIDWDVRGILAILAVIGAFGLAGAQLFLGLGSDIPAWAATLVGAVAGFYFGSRGGSNGYH